MGDLLGLSMAELGRAVSPSKQSGLARLRRHLRRSLIKKPCGYGEIFRAQLVGGLRGVQKAMGGVSLPVSIVGVEVGQILGNKPGSGMMGFFDETGANTYFIGITLLALVSGLSTKLDLENEDAAKAYCSECLTHNNRIESSPSGGVAEFVMEGGLDRMVSMTRYVDIAVLLGAAAGVVFDGPVSIEMVERGGGPILVVSSVSDMSTRTDDEARTRLMYGEEKRGGGAVG